MKLFNILPPLVLISACGAESPSVPNQNQNKEHKRSSFLVSSTSELPNCDGSMVGSLAYVKSEESFYSCETIGGWTQVSIKGERGEKGETGATGPIGPTGVTGSKGETGTPGTDAPSNAVVWKTVKDANGTIMGKTIEAQWGNYSISTIATDKGYAFTVDFNGDIFLGSLDFYYSSTNCSGDAYIIPGYARGTPFKRNNDLFFTNRNASFLKGITINSYKTVSDVCTTSDLTSTYNNFYATKDFFINDPLITGVPSSKFSIPLTIE